MAADNQDEKALAGPAATLRTLAGFASGAARAYEGGMSDLPENAAPDKPLSEAARRALEEAAARRKAAEAAQAAAAESELGGPKGPEPTRFGDWERKGIAVDF